MKKLIFFFLVSLSAYAAPAVLVAKTIPSSEISGYFILSDGTYWKVSTFIPRWRSPLEWLWGEEVFVPENYKCTMKIWSLGDEFEAFSKVGNARVNEADASNETEIKAHSHILVNSRTEKILFATPLHPADFLTAVYNNGYDEGFGTGLSQGFSSGYSSGYASGQAAALDLDD